MGSVLPSPTSLAPAGCPCLPQRSHPPGRRGDARATPWLAGSGLQLRATASRWNFLTNARPGRRGPGAGRRGRSLPLSPRQVLGSNSWGGPRTVHVSRAGFL